MANESIRRVPSRPEAVGPERPKIWAEGGQRPPFVLRACARASLHFGRSAVAPIHAAAARLTRRVAVNVANGAGRIPEGRLGRFARFVPSHLRVAGWIKAVADILSHASASADPDAKRGNALVAEIAPHLWSGDKLAPNPAGEWQEMRGPETVLTEPLPAAGSELGSELGFERGSEPLLNEAAFTVTEPPANPQTGPLVDPLPTVALEDLPPPPHDPLAAIRDDLAERFPTEPVAVAAPPPPPGATGTMVVQVTGYVTGWLTIILALPYGLVRALWSYAMGTDLRRIGPAD